mmetsp:Transcript_3748/g.14735  ORF Transcript_3748/g.14735 Transcript_3748/m.14735 type:complete len:620 (-) Transcript_3748:1895-3754(-)
MEARLAEIERLRGEGNALMEKDAAREAKELYARAATLASPTEEEDTSSNDEVRATLASLRAACLKNEAAASLRLGEYDEAVTAATAAMDAEGAPSVAALYRRAVAQRMLGEFEGAYDDLVAARRLDASDETQAIVQGEFLKLRRAFTEAEHAAEATGATRLSELETRLVNTGMAAQDAKRLVDGLEKAVEEPFYAVPPPHAQGESPTIKTTTFESLSAEVAALREQQLRGEEEHHAAKPSISVGALRACPAVIERDASGDLATCVARDESATTTMPPWMLDVSIRPPRDAAYHATTTPTCFRLVFSADWPVAPPKIRAVTLLSHAEFDGPRGSHNAHHARRAVLDFYVDRLVERGLVTKDPPGCVSFDLGDVITALTDALTGPAVVGPVPSPKDQQTCTPTSQPAPFAFLAGQRQQRSGQHDAAAVAHWRRQARADRAKRRVMDDFREKHAHAAPELYPTPSSPTLDDGVVWSLIAPATRRALQDTRDPASACAAVTEGVWVFDLFEVETARKLLAEIDCFYASGLPAQRPNSMNNYGVIVNDIGLEPFVTALQRLVLTPIARALFAPGAPNNPPWGDETLGHPGAAFDSHHSFIVKYRADEDPHLDVHTDDSDVTFNV